MKFSSLILTETKDTSTQEVLPGLLKREATEKPGYTDEK